MNIDMSPRTRSVVSGLAAIAISGLLTTSLVEAFHPLLGTGVAGQQAPGQVAAVTAPARDADFRA